VYRSRRPTLRTDPNRRRTDTDDASGALAAFASDDGVGVDGGRRRCPTTESPTSVDSTRATSTIEGFAVRERVAADDDVVVANGVSSSRAVASLA